jgi:hypothetical protein
VSPGGEETTFPVLSWLHHLFYRHTGLQLSLSLVPECGHKHRLHLHRVDYLLLMAIEKYAQAEGRCPNCGSPLAGVGMGNRNPRTTLRRKQGHEKYQTAKSSRTVPAL